MPDTNVRHGDGIHVSYAALAIFITVLFGIGGAVLTAYVSGTNRDTIMQSEIERLGSEIANNKSMIINLDTSMHGEIVSRRAALDAQLAGIGSRFRDKDEADAQFDKELHVMDIRLVRIEQLLFGDGRGRSNGGDWVQPFAPAPRENPAVGSPR